MLGIFCTYTREKIPSLGGSHQSLPIITLSYNKKQENCDNTRTRLYTLKKMSQFFQEMKEGNNIKMTPQNYA
jgi:Zn-dependent alcohol dehydrogenase